MPLEIGLWRVDGNPRRMSTKSMPLESRLEELIEADPAILGEPLLFIGRQVPTAHGKFIDLLAIDAGGGLHVLELKRDRTPRDVVAQTLDYGSWVESLTHEEVLEPELGLQAPQPLHAGRPQSTVQPWRLTDAARRLRPATSV